MSRAPTTRRSTSAAAGWWTSALERGHLELAAELIERGELSRSPVAFVEGYHGRVTPERGTSVAHVLKDFGFVD